MELAVVEVLVEGAHAVHAEAGLAERREDPAPVAEDGAEFGARDQRAADLAVGDQRHDVPGILALQHAQIGLGQTRFLVGLKRGVVVRALVDHGEQFGVDEVEIGSCRRTRGKARRRGSFPGNMHVGRQGRV